MEIQNGTFFATHSSVKAYPKKKKKKKKSKYTNAAWKYFSANMKSNGII
jgi:hypothetical protein